MIHKTFQVKTYWHFTFCKRITIICLSIHTTIEKGGRICYIFKKKKLFVNNLKAQIVLFRVNTKRIRYILV